MFEYIYCCTVFTHTHSVPPLPYSTNKYYQIGKERTHTPTHYGVDIVPAL